MLVTVRSSARPLSLARGEPATPAVRPLSRPFVASFPGVLSTNPYQRLLYAALEPHGLSVVSDTSLDARWLWSRRKHICALHFHWPQSYWRHERGPAPLRRPLSYLKIGLLGARLAFARVLGCRIVWTVHQVLPHELDDPRVDRLGARVLARLSSALIAHDLATVDSIRRELGPKTPPIHVVAHGSYVGAYPAGRPRSVVRKELGIGDGEFVFLCFGDLRAYKDVDRLLRAFRDVRVPSCTLVVAGSVGDEKVAAAVTDAAAAGRRVHALLGFVPRERVSELYGAADVVVVARGDGGTSGSLVLALSQGSAVVVADRPAYVELAGGAVTATFRAGDDESLRRALETAASQDRRTLTERGRAGALRAAQLDWREIGCLTAAILVGDGR
jgi:glycosyltransferase involved in cell wall biosynthesis